MHVYNFQVQSRRTGHSRWHLEYTCTITSQIQANLPCYFTQISMDMCTRVYMERHVISYLSMLWFGRKCFKRSTHGII